MVALRLPIHVAQPVSLAASSCGTGLLSGPLLALAVAAASMLGNAYLDISNSDTHVLHNNSYVIHESGPDNVMHECTYVLHRILCNT